MIKSNYLVAKFVRKTLLLNLVYQSTKIQFTKGEMHQKFEDCFIDRYVKCVTKCLVKRLSEIGISKIAMHIV